VAQRRSCPAILSDIERCPSLGKSSPSGACVQKQVRPRLEHPEGLQGAWQKLEDVKENVAERLEPHDGVRC
jgi:hypothetical protein